MRSLQLIELLLVELAESITLTVSTGSPGKLFAMGGTRHQYHLAFL